MEPSQPNQPELHAPLLTPSLRNLLPWLVAGAAIEVRDPDQGAIDSDVLAKHSAYRQSEGASGLGAVINPSDNMRV